MQKVFFATTIVLLLLTVKTRAQQDPEGRWGWKLGSQAWTFNKFTFFEAVDKIKSCGLSFVEAFPGQPLGGGLEGDMDFHMPTEKRQRILAMLKEKGVKMIAFGVVNAKDPEDWKKLFEFAKNMDIENLTSEPEEKDFSMISKLCDEYKINIAIHDHPKPSHYWSPEIVLKAIQGQSSRIGACADIGHWVRSGLDPVECLKKLSGHIKGLHFKDLNEKSPEAHDVPWGTGISDVASVIRELKRQGFKGPISAEYEYNWDNNTPDVTASVKYFRAEILRLK
ncbi:MAG: sugar phosphate isomerase/epimerase [Chitinophagaceae bacterium]|nr:sugar phosphate isomerase/epimerase [Chitinophagaceae bacterium]